MATNRNPRRQIFKLVGPRVRVMATSAANKPQDNQETIKFVLSEELVLYRRLQTEREWFSAGFGAAVLGLTTLYSQEGFSPASHLLALAPGVVGLAGTFLGTLYNIQLALQLSKAETRIQALLKQIGREANLGFGTSKTMSFRWALPTIYLVTLIVGIVLLIHINQHYSTNSGLAK
jgi:hypothetical protein